MERDNGFRNGSEYAICMTSPGKIPAEDDLFSCGTAGAQNLSQYAQDSKVTNVGFW